MAYYMRSNDVHDDPRYLMHGLGSTIKSAWGNMKGSWSKPVKYVDKRIINGRMQYLYPEMLEKARQAGQAVKNTAKNAATKVANTYNQAKKSVNDFRNYSNTVNSRYDRAEEEVRKREARIEKNDELFDKNDAATAKNNETFNKASQEARDLADQLKVIEQTYGKNSEQYRVMKDDYDKVRDFIDENNKDSDQLYQREEELRNARETNGAALDKAYEAMYQANAEKDTFKYKASRFLDNILRGNTEPYTKAGVNWLKNQLEAGNQWLSNAPSNAANIARDIRISVGNKLDELATSDNPILSNGASFLQHLVEGDPIEPITPNIVISEQTIPENVVRSTGRNYSGTSQKAERQGEGLNNQQAVDRAYDMLRQAREDAGWKQHSDGSWSGRSTPETVAAMEEYLRLLEQQGGPVGGIRNSSSYGTRPRR